MLVSGSAGLLARRSPGAGGSPADKDDAWKRCRANDPDVRIEACRALIDSRPESPADLASAHYSRGTAYRQKGRFAEAVDDFNAAINANPSLIDAYGERGITFTILGRFNDAIPDFTRVIEVYPRLAYPYYNRGLCYELIGLDDLAIEDITNIDRDRAACGVPLRAPRNDLLPQETAGSGACRLRAGPCHQPAIRSCPLCAWHRQVEKGRPRRRRSGHRRGEVHPRDHRDRDVARRRQVGRVLIFRPAGSRFAGSGHRRKSA